MRLVRLAVTADLAELQRLYLHLNPARPVLADDVAETIFAEILGSPRYRLFVAEWDGALVASAMLVTAPNLMRGGRPIAFIENVVTHAEYRRQGHGRAIIAAALAAAWEMGAFQVMLMSGRPDPGVHAFYRDCGLRPDIKTGYVAFAPAG